MCLILQSGFYALFDWLKCLALEKCINNCLRLVSLSISRRVLWERNKSFWHFLFVKLSNSVVSTFTDVCSVTCDFDVQASGEFISCDSSKYCKTSTWVITAPPRYNIRLKFAIFQLSDSSKYGQYWIHIYDGRNTNNTMLGTFTGTRRPFVIQSSGRFMLVKLTKQYKLYPGSCLCNFKGVYTFGTSKGKLLVIYLIYFNDLKLKQIKL